MLKFILFAWLLTVYQTVSVKMKLRFQNNITLHFNFKCIDLPFVAHAFILCS